MILLTLRARGSQIVSRLADSFGDKFIAFGFLCAGYMPARPVNNFKELLVQVRYITRIFVCSYSHVPDQSGLWIRAVWVSGVL